MPDTPGGVFFDQRIPSGDHARVEKSDQPPVRRSALVNVLSNSMKFFSSLGRYRPPVRFIGPTLFGLIVIYMLTTAILCLISSAERIGTPFPGFLYHQSHDVGSVNDRGWAGVQAGVLYRDVILEVNGRPVHSGRDIEEIVRQTPIGDTLHYLLSRRGETFALDIPVSIFTLQDFFKTFAMLFPFGIGLWMIGLVVYVLKRDAYVSWVFLLFCLNAGTYIMTSIDIFTMHDLPWSYHLNMWALALVPASSVHLSLLFPEKTVTIQKWPRLPVFLYGIGGLLAFSHSFYFEALQDDNQTMAGMMATSASMLRGINFNRVYVLVGWVALVAAGVHAYRQSSSVIVKQRARIILLSSSVAFIPSGLIMAGVTLGKLGIPFNWITPIVIVFPAAVGYAIGKHNLFDVDVYVKRTVGYLIMTTVVGLGYFVVQTVFSTFVLKPVFGEHAENVYPIVFALLVVFFFNPINSRVQEGVDRLFFRKTYDYKTTMGFLSDALSRLTGLEPFFKNVIHTLQSDMFIDRVGVVTLDTRKGACQTMFSEDQSTLEHGSGQDDTILADDPLLSLLKKEHTLISKYDLQEDPQYVDVREACLHTFTELGGSIAVPIICQDEFSGFLVLGHKKSGHFYSRDDIDVVKTASSMLSTAMEQIREKDQRGMLMQMFSKHVSTEVAESLWDQRDQFLEGGRPRTQKLTVTVMFTDFQGFTSVSEKMDPQVLMDFINTYMESITMTVMKHGGVVDNYIGDGVMINFGFPVPSVTL
jgi:hypothetical protein